MKMKTTDPVPDPYTESVTLQDSVDEQRVLYVDYIVDPLTIERGLWLMPKRSLAEATVLDRAETIRLRDFLNQFLGETDAD